MVAISTPNISLAYKKLATDFPAINFVYGDDFHWSLDRNTITHPEISSEDDLALLLHEVGHASLGHSEYLRDIELISMERQAWEFAVDELALRYQLELSMGADVVQDALDSYRDWLHARSSCPDCEAIGIEESVGSYKCLICQSKWVVNEARTCQLKRYKQ